MNVYDMYKRAIKKWEGEMSDNMSWAGDDPSIQEDLLMWDVSVEALKKRIPEKPIFHRVFVDEWHTCPDLNCGRVVEFREFCDSCGQRLDWGVDYEA